MSPKILFTDIDGTLLDKYRELSHATVLAVNRISNDQHVPVILVSARMPKSMRLLQTQLRITDPIICYNGGLVFGKDSSEVLEDHKLLPFVVNEIAQKVLVANLHLSVFVNDLWLVNKFDEWAEREIRNTKVRPASIDGIDDFINGAHKIMIMGEPEKIDEIQNWIIENKTDKVNCYRSKATYLEISSKRASKYIGIKKILSLYKYELSDAIAIGDHYNDLEMIQHAGIGVAVNNAANDIKKVAKFICPSNVEDGVAFTINKYF